MKKNILLLAVSALLFASCKQSNLDMINNLIAQSGQFDKAEVGKLLSSDFFYLDKNEKEYNRIEYLSRLDSLKSIDYKSEILTIQDMDSIVKTEENITTVFDSIMEGIPNMIQKKTYVVENDKIKSITVDSTLNYDKYTKALDKKLVPILYYAQEQSGQSDNNEILRNIKKYLKEYSNLSNADKTKYSSYSKVQGRYIGRGLFNEFEFKRGHCRFSYFGIRMGGKYTVEGDCIYLDTGTGELGTVVLKIINSNTLKGEGWAFGTFVKR